MSFFISFSHFSFKTGELNNTREKEIFLRTVTEEVGISVSKNMYLEIVSL